MSHSLRHGVRSPRSACAGRPVGGRGLVSVASLGLSPRQPFPRGLRRGSPLGNFLRWVSNGVPRSHPWCPPDGTDGGQVGSLLGRPPLVGGRLGLPFLPLPATPYDADPNGVPMPRGIVANTLNNRWVAHSLPTLAPTFGPVAPGRASAIAQIMSYGD